MTYPPDFTNAAYKEATAQQVAFLIATLVPAPRRTVVQAGGCSGLWPLALAQHFERVITFEPAPQNFQCLTANVATAPTIAAHPYALGERSASVGLTRPKPKAGLWQVSGDGPIPMVRLDDVLDAPIDALVLDVEGSEVQAWQGAAQTIARDRPLLWFEWMTHTAAIEAWLAAHDYTPPTRGIAGDAYSVHASRVKES